MRTTMQEIYESHLNGLAFCAFLFAIRSLLGAAAFAFADFAAGLQTGASIAGWLAWAVLIITMSMLGFRHTRLLWSLSGPADLRRRGRYREEGFTFNAFKTASWLSCVLTGVTLVFLDLIAEDVTLPAGFFIKLALFFCLGTFSIVYFVLNFALAGQAADHGPAA